MERIYSPLENLLKYLATDKTDRRKYQNIASQQHHLHNETMPGQTVLPTCGARPR